MRLSKKKFWSLLLLLFASALGLLFVNRVAVLVSIGKVLLVQEEIERPGDLIVPLRGGRGYERFLEAFELYKTGKGDKICIMKSLDDLRFGKLERFGIMLPTGQEQNRSVLIQLGVPETDIIVDHQKPGGGTYGEALRVKRLVGKYLETKRILVVTSWYHTRRAKIIYEEVFQDCDLDVMVIPALRNAESTCSDWWKYRYETGSVLQEIVKIATHYLRGLFKFSDDYPQKINAGGEAVGQ